MEAKKLKDEDVANFKKIEDLESAIEENIFQGENSKTGFDALWDDFKWEVNYQWNHMVWYPWKSLSKGLDNFRRYRKIIWRDRWWDYSFILELELFKLKDMQEHWGKDTHYVNDLDDKEIIDKLVEDLEWMLNDEKELEDGYEEEYKKRSRSFYGRLDRNHRKLWD